MSHLMMIISKHNITKDYKSLAIQRVHDLLWDDDYSANAIAT